MDNISSSRQQSTGEPPEIWNGGAGVCAARSGCDDDTSEAGVPAGRAGGSREQLISHRGAPTAARTAERRRSARLRRAPGWLRDALAHTIGFEAPCEGFEAPWRLGIQKGIKKIHFAFKAKTPDLSLQPTLSA